MSAEAQWIGQPSIRGSNESVRMVLLTLSLVGLQFTWGIEMTYCTPYLLSLGLSKSATSVVWLAGPLSGLVMQPLIGTIADRSRSKWGRRRPYMLGGTAIVVLCLLFLGWTREIVGIFSKDAEKSTATVAVAVASIWILDFAVNAVQASDRSLIVDTLPLAKQEIGSAWASRMTAVGHLVGYCVGTLNLRDIWGDWLGNTQLKQLIWVAIIAVVVSQSLTAWAVNERVLLTASDEARGGAFQVVLRIFKTIWRLPKRIQAICWIQFWSWIGWFPFLFYSPTWVGETYFRYEAPADKIDETDDILGEIGRIGSLSLVIFSIITFAGSILLPLLIQTTEAEKSSRSSSGRASRYGRIAALMSQLDEYKPDLRQVWLVGHCIFAGAMILAPLVRGVAFATVLVSICGIPWALASWAPFAFIGVEINRLTAPSTMTAAGSRYQQVSSTDVGDEDGEGYDDPENHDHEVDEEAPLESTETHGAPTMLRINHMRSMSRSDAMPGFGDDNGSIFTIGSTDGSTGETSGIYLGILNLYTTMPQFVGTFISMIVFAIFEPGKSKILHGGAGGDGGSGGGEGGHPVEGAGTAAQKEGFKQGDGGGINAIGICLFIGALCALGAAYATHRLKYVR